MAGFGYQEVFAALLLGLMFYGAYAVVRSLTIIAKSSKRPTTDSADQRRPDDRA
jgi:hypothetical protein